MHVQIVDDKPANLSKSKISGSVPSETAVSETIASETIVPGTELSGPTISQSIKSLVPDSPGSVITLGAIRDYTQHLFAAERAETDSMVDKRKYAFSSGRYFAHLALATLGYERAAILRLKRAPQWPHKLRGSISHSERIAGTFLTNSLQGVGLDIEKCGRVSQALFTKLFHPSEQQLIASNTSDTDMATAIFSAKEAVYKAAYPIGGTYIGFLEVELDMHPHLHKFEARYLTDNGTNSVINRGQGYWIEFEDHILTLFIID